MRWPDLEIIERDWLSSNQLLAFDGDQATVIDTGYVKHAPMTVALVDRLLRQREQRQGRAQKLARVINTHLHSDHCGGNAALQRAHGCSITVAAAEFDKVARWDEEALSFLATGQRCERFTADHRYDDGDELVLGGCDWRVLSAPGHDVSALMLYCPRHRLLMSGDAFWRSGFGLSFEQIEGGPGLEDQEIVLDRIAALDPAWVLPGHGPVFSDVEDALRIARERLAAFRRDPTVHARSALRVLVKFVMLDRERMPLARLRAELVGVRHVQDLAEIIGMEAGLAFDQAVQALIGQKALRLEEEILTNS